VVHAALVPNSSQRLRVYLFTGFAIGLRDTFWCLPWDPHLRSRNCSGGAPGGTPHE
jgi:hypothetical protein